MKLKRMLAAVLTTATLFVLLAVPAQAGHFPDVYDPEVSRAADTLNALGIMTGNEKNEFLPDGHLTRIQFCKMAIEIMGKGELAKAQMNRTIFTDVNGRHWGRGYANLAATMVIDESTNARLMTGTGNGRFEPDRDITYQEAATLILRILGYSAEANRAWPTGAIQEATALGLDEGLKITDPAGPVTRAQAALLFCRMLSVPAKGEKAPYAQSLGTLVEDAIVLSANATINGQSGWVVTTAGGPYRPVGQADESLVGKRGDVLLDKNGKFVTLLTDESQCVTVTVSRVQGNYLQTTAGTRYTLESETPVYTGTSGEVSTYQQMYPSILPGDVVTIYLDNGKVIGVFCAATTAESGFMVVQGSVSAASLYYLTGADYNNYTIRKNGSTISLNEIKQYDVLTYDPISKVIQVCDTRVNCVYENAYPSPKAPSKITVLGGNQFDVMADAMDSLSRFSIGQNFTLLFTADGRVAGAVGGYGTGGYGVSGNAMGVVSGGKLFLMGINKTLDISSAGSVETLEGQLVSVSGARGQIVLYLMNLSNGGGDFVKSSMRLGRLFVSDSVQIYERGVNGLATVKLSSLPATVSASMISGYHTDTSGNVDLIILRNYTGDSYEYGLIELTSKIVKEPKQGTPLLVDGTLYRLVNGQIVDSSGRVWFENVCSRTEGETLSETCQYVLDKDGYLKDWSEQRIMSVDGNWLDTSYNVLDQNGEIVMEKKEIPQLKFSTPSNYTTYNTTGTYFSTGFGTIRTYPQEDGNYALVSSTLKTVTNVRSADFYTVDDVTYVRTNGQIYQVADDVMCYNASASSGRWVWDSEAEDYVYVTTPQWFSSLLEARTFSATLTIYIDSVGQKVRAVSA